MNVRCHHTEHCSLLSQQYQENSGSLLLIEDVGNEKISHCSAVLLNWQFVVPVHLAALLKVRGQPHLVVRCWFSCTAETWVLSADIVKVVINVYIHYLVILFSPPLLKKVEYLCYPFHLPAVMVLWLCWSNLKLCFLASSICKGFLTHVCCWWSEFDLSEHQPCLLNA